MSKYQEGTIRPAKLKVVIMPNDEVLSAGKSLGFLTDKRPSFTNKDKRLRDYIEEEEE